MLTTLLSYPKRLWHVLERCKHGVRDWFVARAQTAHTRAWLIGISFSEASFFLVPPEALLLPILFADGRRWIYFATITTISSVLGGIFGYAIGFFLFDVIGGIIIETYHLQAQMDHVATLYQDNAFWAIFTAAFTPIPYKVFTLSAGFFSVNLAVFIIASIIGRGTRFFIVSFIAYKYGTTLGALIFKYFNVISLVVVVSLLLFFLI